MTQRRLAFGVLLTGVIVLPLGITALQFAYGVLLTAVTIATTHLR